MKCPLNDELCTVPGHTRQLYTDVMTEGGCTTAHNTCALKEIPRLLETVARLSAEGASVDRQNETAEEIIGEFLCNEGNRRKILLP